jgi:dTDP-4-dehydrorhamnose 3,5-epimerase
MIGEGQRIVTLRSNVEVLDTDLTEVKVIAPCGVGDARGRFFEIWNARTFAAIGIAESFVQDNHVVNPARWTLRGLHYQLPPAAQGKLVRVTRGAIFDVAVDIRRGSPRFGRHVGLVLSAENWHQLWVPAGFAHGYCTLEEDTEVQYKVTDYYSPAHERGIAWNDPELLIAWPVPAEAAIVSERDRRWPRLAAQPDLFEYTRPLSSPGPGPRLDPGDRGIAEEGRVAG